MTPQRPNTLRQATRPVPVSHGLRARLGSLLAAWSDVEAASPRERVAVAVLALALFVVASVDDVRS